MDEGLERFLAAQEGMYEQALAELRRGRKDSHWMWFIFPQVAGLGQSAMSCHYAIRSRDEAQDYLRHPVLGKRLTACTDAVLSHRDRSAEAIFGGVDAIKFRSSMTLFGAVVADERRFADALDYFFGGRADPETLRLLG